MPLNQLRAPRLALASLMSSACAFACGQAQPDAAHLARALTTLDLRACAQIVDPQMAAECVAGVVRSDPSAPDDACAAIADPRWSGECWFTLAERRGAAGERQPALLGCAQAGPYYDECLFHLWTGELDVLAASSEELSAVLAAATPTIAFWSGAETVDGDVEVLLQDELVFRWMRLHRPVPAEACAADDDVCLRGQRMFLVRSLAEDLLRAGTAPGWRDRVCRARTLDSRQTDGLIAGEVDWEPIIAEVLVIACDVDGRRPWNPIFRVRR